MIQPSGSEQQLLHAELMRVMSEETLEEISHFDFETRLWDEVANGPYRKVVFDWLVWIDRNGHWQKLLDVLMRRFARHQPLMTICTRLLGTQQIAIPNVRTWTIRFNLTLTIGTPC